MTFNAVVSAVALGFLAWLLLAPRDVEGHYDLSFMPAVNACFNGLRRDGRRIKRWRRHSGQGLAVPQIETEGHTFGTDARRDRAKRAPRFQRLEPDDDACRAEREQMTGAIER